MQSLIITIHLLAAIFIISLILIQNGKGASAGAAFGGGSSDNVFGSQGAISFLVKLTSILIFIFFVSSMLLGYSAIRKHEKMMGGSISRLNGSTSKAVNDRHESDDIIIKINKRESKEN